MAAPLALVFGGFLFGGILIDKGAKDIKSTLSGASSTASTSSTSSTPGVGSANYTGAEGGGTAGDQKTFGKYLAQYTGLNPTFVNAWLLHEQPPGSPATPGSNNWLNVGYTDSGPDATYYQIAGMNPQQAAQATANWLKANQPSILGAVGKGLAAQVAALENSGWASSHYGNEPASQFLST